MTDAHPDGVAGVKRWFETLATLVQEVDYIGARPTFAPDTIAFDRGPTDPNSSSASLRRLR
jgi:hypothetical protein